MTVLKWCVWATRPTTRVTTIPPVRTKGSKHQQTLAGVCGKTATMFGPSHTVLKGNLPKTEEM